MKQQLLLSLKKSIDIYTILDPGGKQVKSKKNVIYREFKDETRIVFMTTILNVNNIQFN